MFKVELIGGPADGKVYEVEDLSPTLRVVGTPTEELIVSLEGFEAPMIGPSFIIYNYERLASRSYHSSRGYVVQPYISTNGHYMYQIRYGDG